MTVLIEIAPVGSCGDLGWLVRSGNRAQAGAAARGRRLGPALT